MTSILVLQVSHHPVTWRALFVLPLIRYSYYIAFHDKTTNQDGRHLMCLSFSRGIRQRQDAAQQQLVALRYGPVSFVIDSLELFCVIPGLTLLNESPVLIGSMAILTRGDAHTDVR
jgi:hypothetical protein